jgi:hypothetical protein
MEPEPLRAAYDLMVRCLQKLKEAGKPSTRDSDVKRKMLEADRGFDEGELGFGKFSRFLLQAEEHGVISLEKTEMGNFRVSLAESEAPGPPSETVSPPSEAVSSPSEAVSSPSDAVGSPSVATESGPSRGSGFSSGRLGPRGGSGGRKESEGPKLLEGQIVGRASVSADRSSSGGGIDVGGLGLPTSEAAIVGYLTNSYGGVGKKTAESLVEAFGTGIFTVFQTEPERVAEIVPRRAHQVLAEWKTDFERRSEKSGNGEEATSEPVGGADPAPEVSPSSAPTPDFSASSGPATDSSPSASTPAPKAGGARRRTRRSTRRPPSSDSDE